MRTTDSNAATMPLKVADQVGRFDDLCWHAGISNGYLVAVYKFIVGLPWKCLEFREDFRPVTSRLFLKVAVKMKWTC